VSKVERKTHRLKMVGKHWTPWRSIPVTGDIRASTPFMKNLKSIWANSRFEVQCYEVGSPVGGIVQLVIARHGHLETVTWNDIQRIKTELFGVDNFALELYPAEHVAVEMKTRIIWVMPKGYEPPCGLHLPSAWGGL
jgi:hypothetical protein